MCLTLYFFFLVCISGYIYANGVDESMNGLSMAVAGLTGIFGTFLFTRCRPRFGLERTGFIAFTIEILCQSICLASVFAPGTPFKPISGHGQKYNSLIIPELNITHQNNKSFHDHVIVKRHIIGHYPDIHEMSPSTYSHMNDFIHLHHQLENNFHLLSKRNAEGKSGNGTVVMFPLWNEKNIMTSEPYEIVNGSNIGNDVSEVETKTAAAVFESSSKFTVSQEKNERTNTEITTIQTVNYVTDSPKNDTDYQESWKQEGPTVSVILLIIGLVTSRTGEVFQT